ncbi:dTDP-4-dehydrorhamnose reductase [Mycobacterium aquaticum]|uniref:dTDP-4-dehydrorhamnose reductase n=1 Tax=Mycobacterium aquaticum TaxID=1927124 RepID=A0A1X0AA72_9MYCO|nr:dTDP-4-dehydrorhamnose reductase [Mycobacterium aquaticum]ORA26971.1 dTDP-4-dehydrorhamnose reductase [Mycobacterium aquaticum]
MSQRIVVTGAGGMLGRVLTDQARRAGRQVLALTSSECDITDLESVRRHVVTGDVVINCAAYTQVDAAEADEDRAYEVNAVGAGNIAQVCAQTGADLVHVSTDYVFDGVFDGDRRPYEIDDDTKPINAYGRTKLAGEQAVLAAKPDAHVVRTAWVYKGGDGTDFVATMRRLAAGDKAIDVVDDQIGSPTYVDDLATALLEIADGRIGAPVLHAVNSGVASRFELAQATFAAVGADPERVRPVGSDRHPRPATRPNYTVLAQERSVAAGMTGLRDWRDALVAAISAYEGKTTAAGKGAAGQLPSTP